MAKSIVIFVAHSDDEVLGVGGTIAKFSEEGYKVYTIICSYGESTHPHLQPEVIGKIRQKEAEKADKVLGGHGVTFLGLKEGSFLKQINYAKIERLFKKYKPEKVFTHDSSDPHPDHRAVHKIALKIRKKISFEMYTFHIWTIWNRQQGNTPLLYIDISDVFRKKIAALHCFKSQMSLLTHAQINNIVYIGAYIRAIIAGIRMKVKYAEVFHKL